MTRGRYLLLFFLTINLRLGSQRNQILITQLCSMDH